MNTNALLEQLLKSGQNLLRQNGSSPSAQTGALGGLTDLLGAGGSSKGLAGVLSGFGGKAAAAGAISVLLGNKKLGKLASYGGLAALGVMAYRAFNNYQAQQGAVPQTLQTIDRLAPEQQQLHSQAILVALIAAAKADGHIDEQERALIAEQCAAAEEDPALANWISAQLNKPLDVSEVAAHASTPELAGEMYLASLLVIDRNHFLERAYLDELAKHLGLSAELVIELEAQASKAP